MITTTTMVGICKTCEHHRMDHDDQEYPKITFCHLCKCNEYCDIP